MKRALITGITGQDGSYLAELLLEKGYRVYGLIRRTSDPNHFAERIKHISDQVTLIDADLVDQSSLINTLKIAQPHEVYNLTAQSFVPHFLDPARSNQRGNRPGGRLDVRGSTNGRAESEVLPGIFFRDVR